MENENWKLLKKKKIKFYFTFENCLGIYQITNLTYHHIIIMNAADVLYW